MKQSKNGESINMNKSMQYFKIYFKLLSFMFQCKGSGTHENE